MLDASGGWLVVLVLATDGVESETFCVCNVESSELTGFMFMAHVYAIRRPAELFRERKCLGHCERPIFGVSSEI